MKRIVLIGMCAAVAALGLMGCEWSSTSGDESWSSAYDWVNFSGVYRGLGGGLLVTDYTTTPSIPGVTNTYSRTDSGGTMPARETTKSGRVSHGSIVPGSFMVSVGSIAQLSDPGKNGLLTGNGSGTVNYGGGTWAIEIDTFSTVDQNISISYSYTVARDGSTAGGAESGATRFSIYSFNVVHQGQHLTVTDNNGSVYTGRIKKMQSASGYQNTDITQVGTDEEGNDKSAKYTYQESPLPTDGDTIVATIECAGVSKAGMTVKLVGTLQGTVAASIFTGRRMDGTWIELGGKTGDISAQTEAVSIQTVILPEEGAEDTGGT